MPEYISREAAIEAVKKERDYTGKFTFEEEHAWAVGFHQGVSFALSDIATIPAADVRPVVRGTWKPHKTKTGKNWWKCSACDYVSEHKAHHNYCPNCGARMEGET